MSALDWFDNNTTDLGLVVGFVCLMAAVALAQLVWEWGKDE